MARLFLIRHGEPTAAWGGGDDDPGLSELGRAQAAAAAEALAGLGRLAVVSSPKRRCTETAAPYLARVGLEAAGEGARFGEVVTPANVGDRRAWLAETFPWRAGTTPRAWRDVSEPIQRWRAMVTDAARAIREDTAVFTHFIATNAIVGAAMQSETTIVFRPDYASITELEVLDGVLHVRRLGAEMRDGEVR